MLQTAAVCALGALVQNVLPVDRITVSVLAAEHDHGQPDPSSGPVIAEIAQVFGNAAIIPMRIGGGASRSEMVGCVGPWLSWAGLTVWRRLGASPGANAGAYQEP